MWKLLLGLFLYISVIPGYTQTVLHVQDGFSGEGLSGATMQCADREGVVLDEYTVVVLTEGCIIRFIGYESYTVTLSDSADTLQVFLMPSSKVLKAITIEGFQDSEKLTNVAGGYAYLSKKDNQAFQDVSPLLAFNLVPGVRMEQRSPGSYRFNLRGSTLRSPFGVRNVKVYWNNIPFTEPTGATPFNMLDMESVDGIDIIRGPAGSVYGAGIGGVILMDGLKRKSHGLSLDGGISAGSFGMVSGTVGVQHFGEQHGIQLRGSILNSDGYRNHSAVDRKNITLNGQTRLNRYHSLRYDMFFADMNYELPGGLTADQRDENPRAAREASEARDSRIAQTYILGGLTHTYERKNSVLSTSVFFTSSRKENPFVTNYEFEDLSGSGLRTRYMLNPGEPEGPWKVIVGGEWQWGRQEATNFGNSDGLPDTLRFADDNRQFTGFEYGKLTYSRDDWHFSLGASINHLHYSFDRLRDVAADTAYTINRRFQAIVSPRLAVVRTLGNWAVHGSYSLGFSPPTLDEIRTSDGAVNESLVAERGHNLEVGLRGDFISNRLMADVNFFQLWQQNTIVNQVQEGGFSTFRNSGSTSQRGMELLLGYSVIRRFSGFWREVYIRTATTLNHFRFTDYQRSSGGENIDYSGNALTGAPAYIQASSLSLTVVQGLQMELRHTFVNKIPLNDANTVYSRSYHLMNVKIMWDKPINSTLRVQFYGGVDNLLNQKYSLGNDLNAFGARYFNPAATLNAYGGIRVYFYSD